MNKICLVILFSSVATCAFSLPLSRDALSAHNKLRILHSAPALEWDTKLAAYAQKYASQCKFAHSGSAFGENLAAGYPTISAAIQAWYAEQKNYSFDHPGFSATTGHFTQLIWKSSTRLGCGYELCAGKNGTPGHLLVCEYSPAGNVTNEGYFENNVLAKK